MKIKLSKNQWQEMGKKAGWIKTSAHDLGDVTITKEPWHNQNPNEIEWHYQRLIRRIDLVIKQIDNNISNLLSNISNEGIISNEINKSKTFLELNKTKLIKLRKSLEDLNKIKWYGKVEEKFIPIYKEVRKILEELMDVTGFIYGVEI